jgi:hypothetical protein
MAYRLLDVDSPPSREALRLIIEVFRDGHRAAEDLRDTADEMTQSQLEHELESIEQNMLSQITHICRTYHVGDSNAPRN